MERKLIAGPKADNFNTVLRRSRIMLGQDASPLWQFKLEHKKDHIRRSLEALALLNSKNYAVVYDSLPPHLQQNRSQYIGYLGRCHSILAAFSGKDKYILAAALALQDSCYLEHAQDIWAHNELSAQYIEQHKEEVKKLFALNEKDLEEVITLVKTHGSFSHLGVDIYPEDINDLSDDLRRKVLIFDIVDCIGRPDRTNRLSLRAINIFFKIFDKDLNEDGFFWYRLSNLLSPIIVIDSAVPIGHLERTNMLKEHLTPEVETYLKRSLVLNKKLRVQNFKLFLNVFTRSPDHAAGVNNFLKLLVLICRQIEEKVTWPRMVLKEQGLNDEQIENIIRKLSSYELCGFLTEKSPINFKTEELPAQGSLNMTLQLGQ